MTVQQSKLILLLLQTVMLHKLCKDMQYSVCLQQRILNII